MKVNSIKAFLATLTGVASGIAIGILVAPDKGSATRKKITQKGDDYLQDIKQELSDLRSDLNRKVEKSKEEMKNLGQKGKAKAEEMKEEVKDSAQEMKSDAKEAKENVKEKTSQSKSGN